MSCPVKSIVINIQCPGHTQSVNGWTKCKGNTHKSVMVHSLSSGKGKMFLYAACHAFTPHVNAWKNLIGIVVQIQARG